MTEVTGSVIGHYRIDNLVGAGGMGTVYKAYDLNLSRPVALKLMHPEIARVPQFRERLKAEAQTAANLDHPSIVKIYNFGETDDAMLYVAMEFIKDGSLRSHLQRVLAKRGQLELPLVLQIAIQIADALDFAHQAGVIHRDVKQGNLILKRLARPEESGFAAFRAILTDFGLVQIVNGSRLTEGGMAMGTPIYMSPEQCEGEPLDGRSDIYSLGVVLYEMLTGRPPFEFRTLSQAVAAHTKLEYPAPVRELRNDVPPLIDALLSRALAKDRSDRFASAKEMSDALRMAFFSISDAPTSWWTTKPKEESGDLELLPPLAGDELFVRTLGRGAIDRYALTKQQYAIGRSGDNDLVLASGAVSRHHARLEHTSHGWMLRPLVGINGTYLLGDRLAPDKQQAVRPGEPILIGPYEMWISAGGSEPILEPTMIAEPTHYQENVPQDATVIAAPEDAPTQTMRRDMSEPDADAFALFIAPRSADVEPGRSAEFVLEILNRSAIDDRVRLEIGGIPNSWVDLSPGFTPIPAGERAELRFRVTPPRTPETSYGRQRFRIELEAQRSATPRPTVHGELNIATFEAFEVVMQPRDVKLPETVTVSVTNQGNQPAEYAVVARESEGKVKVSGERGRVRIAPGQTAAVGLEFEGRSGGWRSAESDIPFEVEVRSSTGAVQVQHGTAFTGMRALPILQLIGISLLVMLCLLSGIFAFEGFLRSRSTGQQVDFPAPGTGQFNSLASPTPLQGGAPASPTPLATFTPTALDTGGAVDPNDVDGDGLTNDREAVVGSNPTLADTDGDGLDDRAEVFETGTQPNNRDSDGDGLSDGDEVLIYQTSPRNRDSDNDGIDDATEISQGSNPLVAELASVTQAVQTLAPTELPTLAAPATETPIPTAVPTAIIGVADTPTPVAPTATTVPTAVPTDVPTTEPTVEPTTAVTVAPIPTNTPTLMPATDVPTAIPASPTPVETPTLIATETPTVTATAVPTATATNVPLDPTATIPTSSVDLGCAPTAPVVDGVLGSEEWAETVVKTVTSENGEQFTVYLVKDSQTLYIAVDVLDPTTLPTDSLRIYFDVNNSGGDPDAEDRYLRVGLEDGAQQLWAGIGDSEDGALWDVGATAQNENLTVAVTTTDSGWVIEASIATDVEMPGLGAEFGMMVQMLFTDSALVDYPDSAESENASTWQPVTNTSTCE